MSDHRDRGLGAAEVERRLRAAFDAQAQDAVGEQDAPPPPRFAAADGLVLSLPHRPAELDRRRRSGAWLVPAAAAAVVVLVAGIVALLQLAPSGGTTDQVAGHGQTSPAVHSPGRGTAAQPAPRPGTGRPVHIELATEDTQPVGVGLPVIAYFSRRPTEGTDLARATTVTVNGRPVHAAWYFELSSARRGYPVEAHLRMARYWPADSTISVRVAAQDVRAGAGLRFVNYVATTFTTTAAVISTVDATTHRLTVTSDGRTLGSFPVSLGAADTPTSRGTKVIMEKGTSVCMSGPGYDECGVKYTQRLTYGGEYLAAAPWNAVHILDGVNTSDGCTDLMPGDAKRLYSLLRVGDVVNFPNADGPAMTMGAGYGDWNVPWSVWQKGGLVPTS